MRLNRFLAASGVASRRSAEKLILAGRVKVNGRTVRELATFVEPGKDIVLVNGRPVEPGITHTYLLLHKPTDVITSASDPHGRRTVQDLVPRVPRVFAVGRLDQDTTGALLLTDDGDLAHRLAHPRYGIEKEYVATVEGVVEPEALDALRKGVELEDGMTAPCTAESLERRGHRSRVRLVLHEGRNRQVRRMLEAVGHPVTDLVRVRIGPLTLAGLEAGTHRALTEDEVRALRRAVQAARPAKSPRRRGRSGRKPGPRTPKETP